MINNQEEWEEMLEKPFVYVVDAYCGWAGPCTAIVGFFKSLRNSLGDPLLKFSCVSVDEIEALENYRGKCEPNFLIYGSGHLIGAVRGCNATALEKTIAESLETEKKVQSGELNREDVVIEENYDGTESEINDADGGAGGDLDASEESVDSLFEERKKIVTIALVKPDIVKCNLDEEIVDKITERGMDILAEMEVVLTTEEAGEFYQAHAQESYYETLVEYMTSGPCRVMALTMGETGEGVIELWREMIGPFDAALAKENNPTCLRSLYGTDAAINGLHGSSSEEEAVRELTFFFPDLEQPTYRYVVPHKFAGQKFRRTKSGSKTQRTLAIIRPDALREYREEILAKIEELGMVVAMQKEVTLNQEQVEAFYEAQMEAPYYKDLCEQMISGPVLALCLKHEDAVNKWKQELGPKTIKEIQQDGECLRAQFLIDGAQVNMLHGSETQGDAENELGAFFEMSQTFAVIKPEGYDMREKIIEKLEEEGLVVSCQKTVRLNTDTAEEIYQSKDTAPFYDDLIAQMTSGPCLMLVLSAENAIKKLRKCLGSVDPKLARKKIPDSLRAQFGWDILKNSVHAASNDFSAKHNIELIFGEAEFDWDGFYRSEKWKPIGQPVPETPRLMMLAPPVDSESEEEEGDMDDLAPEDEEYQDPGPLSLIPPGPTEEELAAAAAAAAAQAAAEKDKKKKGKGKKKGKKGKKHVSEEEEIVIKHGQRDSKGELLEFGVRTTQTWSDLKLGKITRESSAARPKKKKEKEISPTASVKSEGKSTTRTSKKSKSTSKSAKGGKGEKADKGGKADKKKGKGKADDKHDEDAEAATETATEAVAVDPKEIIECISSTNPLTKKCSRAADCAFAVDPCSSAKERLSCIHSNDSLANRTCQSQTDCETVRLQAEEDAMRNTLECITSTNPLTRKCSSVRDCQELQLKNTIECITSTNPLTKKCSSVRDCNSINPLTTPDLDLIECIGSTNPDTKKCASVRDCAVVEERSRMSIASGCGSQTKVLGCISSNNPHADKCSNANDCDTIAEQQVHCDNSNSSTRPAKAKTCESLSDCRDVNERESGRK